MKCVSSVFLLFFSCAIHSASITWLRTDAPPFSMPKNDSQQGVCDLVLTEIIRHAPHINHQVLTIPQARTDHYLAQGDNVCVPCLIKRPDTPLIKYSVATSVYPDQVVISTVQKKVQITAKHEEPINLQSLLLDDQLRYGQSLGRKYSESIQNLMNNIQSREDVTASHRSSDQANVLGDMLVANRIDYGIDYPFIAQYYNNKHDQALLATTKIHNTNSQPILGAVGCAQKAPDNFAASSIELINRVLAKDILPSERYKQHQKQWLGHYFDDFEGLYDEHVLIKKPVTGTGFSDNQDK
ncbi:hypothetical protein AAEU32_01380 [Pseudoalteromonas sp. SSDWG2]|uniref:hypothetical protein n=1 Tax=Pseudoalteromonas sp. SSDWG2 TaxID=3139391 RepID=UPI003BAD67F5